MSLHSGSWPSSRIALLSTLTLAALSGSLLSSNPATARQVVLSRVIVVNQAPPSTLYYQPQPQPIFFNPAIASPNFSNGFPNGYSYGCFHPCITPYPAVGGGHNVLNGSVVNSTLVNPVVVNSPIYNSTLVNPVIIQRPRYRPGIRGSFSISF